MAVIKLLFCTLFAWSSIGAMRLIERKNNKRKIYQWSIVAGILLKFTAVVVMYTFYPTLNESSDAALYYYPQALQTLAGDIPYRDFETSYSFLFPYLLIPILALWKSIGAIVLTMLIAESLMIAIYLKLTQDDVNDDKWKVIFLYTFSPLSLYWVTLTGYNGIIIALFAMTALYLTIRGKEVYSGITLVLGFLCSKLLFLLMIPGIVFCEKTGWKKRLSATLVMGAIIMLLLSYFNIDVFQPIKIEFEKNSSGNLWFLLSPILPHHITTSTLYRIIPIILFVLFFIYVLNRYALHTSTSKTAKLDLASAFMVATTLLFMIISRKSYTFYIQMMLVFLIHTMVSVNKTREKDYHLFPLAVLGTITTIEPHLWKYIRHSEVFPFTFPAMALYVVDLILVACYTYYLWMAFQALKPYHQTEKS